MVALSLLIFIAASLMQLSAAGPSDCKKFLPKKIDLKSQAFSGKWYLLRWATQYEPYRKEFGHVDNAYFVNSPVVRMNKTLMKGYMRVGDECISEIEAYRLSNNGMDFTCEAKPFMVFRILNTKIRTSLLFHMQEKREGRIFHTISLYGRNPIAMENELKIFDDQVQCVGMKSDKIVVPPRLKAECSPQDTVEAIK
ncbi:major urinary protein 3-like [Leucoraja erinacea]|uniref:major urinary protein 3-like n=1 Tax=Leucoraja erinaceus TaxID=7782 RepID=UPI0024550830|nr:major urinary protein 3-like [Leucoraja erinacea]